MGDQYPVKAVGLGGRQSRTGPEFGHIFDHHAVVYEFANGVKCFSYCRQQPNGSEPPPRSPTTSRLVHERQRSRRDAAQHRPSYNLHRRPIPGRFRDTAGPCRADMYQVEHNELFASIRNGRPINNGEYMAKSTLMAIMGRMAAYTGQVITWEQALNSREDLTPARYEWGPLPLPPVARPGITQFS